MAEDDHAKYRPDDEGDDDETETEGNGSSHEKRRKGEYVHAPAVDVTDFDAEENPETERDRLSAVDRDGEEPDGSAPTEEATEGTAESDADEVEWAGQVSHAAGVETPVPRNLMASIVAVFAILGSGMALLGLLFSGFDLVVFDSLQIRSRVSLLSAEVLMSAVPAQAGVVAVLAGFYAGAREEETEAVIAAAVGTFLGVVVQTVLVAVFVSTSANLPLQTENLLLNAVFLGVGMAVVTAGCAVLYDRYITHPDGLLGRLSDRMATDERRGASRSRK